MMAWAEDLGMDRPRRRKTSTPAGPHSPVSGGEFAPYNGPLVCYSRAGRWRPKHEFVNGRCLWCDKKEKQ